MKKFNKLIGHNYLFHHLIQLYQSNVLPNKILLSGDKGIGKFILSSHLVNYILSQDEEYKYDFNNLEINNHNRSYLLFKNNSHPNVFIINKKIDKKYIEISQIREMIQFQNQSSFNNKIKYVIIDDLEYFNLNSTNAILKSLEEPNNNLFFILINNSASLIQDTLKSRCIEFKLFLNHNDVKLIVNNFFNENIYNLISKDFLNIYNSPSFLISLVIFIRDFGLDFINLTIEQFFFELIKNKYYIKDQFINENLNFFIELYFYKNINRSKKISFLIKEYFYFKLSQIKKYNLDLESFFFRI